MMLSSPDSACSLLSSVFVNLKRRGRQKETHRLQFETLEGLAKKPFFSVEVWAKEASASTPSFSSLWTRSPPQLQLHLSLNPSTQIHLNTSLLSSPTFPEEITSTTFF